MKWITLAALAAWTAALTTAQVPPTPHVPPPSEMTIKQSPATFNHQSEVEVNLEITLRGQNPRMGRDWRASSWQAYWTYDPTELEVIGIEPNTDLFGLVVFSTWEVIDGVGYIRCLASIQPAWGQEPVAGTFSAMIVRCIELEDEWSITWDKRTTHPDSLVADWPGIEVEPMVLIDCP